MSVRSDLAAVAAGVAVLDYGDLLWRPTTGSVHFIGPDGGFSLPDAPDADPFAELRARFLAVDGVESVEIADEWSPEDEPSEHASDWERIPYTVTPLVRETLEGMLDTVFGTVSGVPVDPGAAPPSASYERRLERDERLREEIVRVVSECGDGALGTAEVVDAVREFPKYRDLPRRIVKHRLQDLEVRGDVVRTTVDGRSRYRAPDDAGR